MCDLSQSIHDLDNSICDNCSVKLDVTNWVHYCHKSSNNGQMLSQMPTQMVDIIHMFQLCWHWLLQNMEWIQIISTFFTENRSIFNKSPGGDISNMIGNMFSSLQDKLHTNIGL